MLCVKMSIDGYIVISSPTVEFGYFSGAKERVYMSNSSYGVKYRFAATLVKLGVHAHLFSYSQGLYHWVWSY